MTKKDFKAGLSASVKAQDVANVERFETAGAVLANLTAALGKQHQAAQPASLRTVVVRHTFSMSESDSALLETLRKAAAVEGSLLTASDICRIGLHAISGYRGEDVIAAVDRLERLRPGRKY
jgi:hypothetical protein